jgi:hypothetical protein
MQPQQSDDKPKVQAITIRLPEDMYEDLRRQAFEERTSINALIVDAVRAKKA